MARIRKFVAYRKLERPYTRISKFKKKSFIKTTANIKKEIAVKIGNVTIGAIAKGAGMIHPNMATMLCFICTDAQIPSKKLKKMLKKAVDKSFNMISVDMDTSTSDMVTIMANGLAGKVNEKQFQSALDFICKELAKKIAVDGEGATSLIECTVKNCSSDNNAKNIAKSIITSNLVKCMVYGKDVNWGRIMAAIGSAGVDVKPEKIDIYINNIKIVSKGTGIEKNKKKVKFSKQFTITADLHNGKKQATAWGCDLTHGYIDINACFRI